MYCRNCGTKISEHAFFCPSCGYKLTDKGNINNEKSNKVNSPSETKFVKKRSLKISENKVLNIIIVILALLIAVSAADLWKRVYANKPLVFKENVEEQNIDSSYTGSTEEVSDDASKNEDNSGNNEIDFADLTGIWSSEKDDNGDSIALTLDENNGFMMFLMGSNSDDSKQVAYGTYNYLLNDKDYILRLDSINGNSLEFTVGYNNSQLEITQINGQVVLHQIQKWDDKDSSK